ncbi:MAG: DNA-binding CsgD family transcriptional regulator [Polyangiales bacterium]|jgi:DNA-binding CsgD family transcriptional regulator
MGMGAFREELARFQERFDAVVATWMPITQNVEGITRFAEHTILGERARVEGIRSCAVGQTITTAWDPATPMTGEVNRFVLSMQIAKRDESPVLGELRQRYAEAHVEDTLRMLIYDGALCLGSFGLLRAIDGKDFTRAELRRAQAEAKHWALTVRALHRQENGLLRTSPAHIVVDERGRVIAASREVEAWLNPPRRQRVAEAAAHIRREGPDQLLIGRYVFEGVTISDGTSSLVYLNAPLGTFSSVALGILSRRQRQVAKLVSIGMSNAECAEELSLSVHTVKQHLGAAFRLMGISRREELVVMLRTRDAPLLA